MRTKIENPFYPKDKECGWYYDCACADPYDEFRLKKYGRDDKPEKNDPDFGSAMFVFSFLVLVGILLSAAVATA